MGIYIKEKELPKNCSRCFYAIHCNKCTLKNGMNDEEVIYYINYKPKDCPLIEIEEEKIKQLL